jgi:mannosyl-oligosaccharide alpha-1,2-mannosidase
MISGYDLLKGPLAGLVPDVRRTADPGSRLHTTNFLTDLQQNKNIESLLDQSKNLADQMKFAFDTPSGVPGNNLNLEAQTTDGSDTNGIATIGTLVLEWTRLSDLTGNDEYARLSQRGESHLLAPKPEGNVPFPGLVGTNVNITSGQFVDASGGWGGGDDSFYEYLIKMYVYDPARFGTYKDR